MTKPGRNKSFGSEFFDMFERWPSQLAIYLTVLTLSTTFALLLDLYFGVSTARVLLYVSPLTVILMIAVPAAYIAACRMIDQSSSRREVASVYASGRRLHAGLSKNKN